MHITKTDLRNNIFSRLYVLKKINLYLKPFPTRKLLTPVTSLVSLFKNLGESNINCTQSFLEIKVERRHYHLFYKVCIILTTKPAKSIMGKQKCIPHESRCKIKIYMYMCIHTHTLEKRIQMQLLI